ncbi:MAG TPA: hypothetical protein VF981_15485 [Gemmatimonadaceae bacterium]
MRKWLLLVILVSACSRGPSPGSSLTGAATARDAATQFLSAVKAQDLQAMGVVWGTERGPARDVLDRVELDKRLVLLQQCYDHDRFQILEESVGSDGGSVVRILLTRGDVTKVPAFKMVRGPSNRWFVLDTDFPTVQGEFCAR